MRTLIVDKVSVKMVADLKSLGCNVMLSPDLSAKALRDAIVGVGNGKYHLRGWAGRVLLAGARQDAFAIADGDQALLK